MGENKPFIGSEALSSGLLNRHQLRTRYMALFPDVYLAKEVHPTLHLRIHAAWLWSRGQGVVAGLSAAALHGAKWIDDSEPVELICASTRHPAGMVTRRDVLLDGEVRILDGLAVTTPERTAFDIGRRGLPNVAVSRVDALANATRLKIRDVEEVARRHRGVRGLRQLESVLNLADAGAQSPRETAVRLLLVRDGLPRPMTQIPVFDDAGRPIAYLDMGWPQWMVAVEYDGDHHRSNRAQYVKDIRRYDMLEQLGWIIVRVIAEDRPSEILRRVRSAIERAVLATSVR